MLPSGARYKDVKIGGGSKPQKGYLMIVDFRCAACHTSSALHHDAPHAALCLLLASIQVWPQNLACDIYRSVYIEGRILMKVGIPPNIENDLFNFFYQNFIRITSIEVGLCHK